MVSAIDFNSAVKTIFQLSGGLSPAGSIQTTDDLRNIYHQFIEHALPDIDVNRSNDPFNVSMPSEDKAAEAFTMSCSMGNPDQSRGFVGEAYPETVREKKIYAGRQALFDLRIKCKEVTDILDLVVHSIIIRKPNDKDGPVAHSSSAANAVGVIWLSFLDDLTKHDLQELYVHELIHQLLFIDDFLHQQFNYARMSEQRNFGLTAISLTPRPLDIVIHSLIVAVELLRARAMYLGEPTSPHVHPPSNRIVASIQGSYRSIKQAADYDTLVTPHIREIIEQGMDVLASLPNRST
jgi:hypothetical protein